MNLVSPGKGLEEVLEKLLQALLKNTPLAVIVVGLLFVLFGASGGVEKYVKVDNTSWRIVLALLGAFVVGFGGLLIWRGEGEADTKRIAKECDPRISSHKNGDEVQEHFQLRGTFVKKPPDSVLAVIELSTSSRLYWFKKAPLLDEKAKQWFADIRVGGNPSSERIIYVAVLGAAGQALRKYYFSVPEQEQTKGGWAGIETLSPDIILHDSVRVRRKSVP
jgi:hypothetical protein